MTSTTILPTSSANQCGGCTFCCFSMVVEELKKPQNVWCDHCAKGKGCKIYLTRPPGCAKFKCLWLSSGWPADMRPDRAKVMFMATNSEHNVACVVHPSYPEVWRSGRVGALIERLRKKIHVIIINGTKRTFLGGDAPVDPKIAAELAKLEGKPG